MTATPARGDGKGLGRRYEFLERPVTYAELQATGVLVPAVCYAPGTRVSAKGKARKPTRADLLGGVVSWWKRLGDGRRTFVFASSVRHSLGLRDEFRLAGVAAEHLDGTTPDGERDAVLGKEGKLARGETTVVCSCSVLKYGVDVPSVECVQIADGFASLVEYLQACGRGLRSAPNKQNCKVIDHSGAVLYHGFPDADREWVLEDDRDHAGEYRKKMERGEAPKPIVCQECSLLFSGSPVCPQCGWKIPAKKGQRIGTKTGSLYEVRREQSYTLDAKDLDRGWMQCVYMAKARSGTLSMAASMFVSKYGRTPWDARVSPRPGAGSPEWKRPAREYLDTLRGAAQPQGAE